MYILLPSELWIRRSPFCGDATLLYRACVHSRCDVYAFSDFRSLMFFIIIYVIYLTGFSTRPVCLAGGYTVSAVSRFEPHSYCQASRMIRGGGGGGGGGRLRRRRRAVYCNLCIMSPSELWIRRSPFRGDVTLPSRACVHSICDVYAFSDFRSLMFFIFTLFISPGFRRDRCA